MKPRRFLSHALFIINFDTISKTKIEGVGSVGERIKSNRFNQNIWGKTLFDHLSFLIHEKDRIGLIGINGTGKPVY